jgi:hypothetical protein
MELLFLKRVAKLPPLMSEPTGHRMKPFLINKASIPLDKFWSLHSKQRSEIVLIGLFINEVNLLLMMLAKAAAGLRIDPSVPGLTPEEEAAESLVAMLLTTLVGKVAEGYDCLKKSPGTSKSILNDLPLSVETKQIQAVLETELSDKLFMYIRNNAGFHYSKTEIDIDILKSDLSTIDAHLFIHPGNAMGFTLSRLPTLALFETMLRKVSGSDRAKRMEVLLGRVFRLSERYSDFLARAYIDLLRKHFDRLPAEPISIPDASTIDDPTSGLRFFNHPPEQEIT